MKDRVLIYIALILSLASLCYAVWLHHQTEIVARQIVKEREAHLVKYLTPQMRELYRGFGVREDAIPVSPNTFEELFLPLSQPLGVISQMPGVVTPLTNKP